MNFNFKNSNFAKSLLLLVTQLFRFALIYLSLFILTFGQKSFAHDESRPPQTLAPIDLGSPVLIPYAYQLPLVTQHQLLVFDWDETVMIMPNQIRLFHKASEDTLLISTTEFSKYRTEIGVPGGKYENYYTKLEAPGGSHDEFQITGPESYFKKTIEKAIQLPETQWQGPAFWNWVAALQNQESANKAYVLSARGHLPEEWNEGFMVLQKYLWQKYRIRIFLPPIENNKGVGSGANVAQRKADWLADLINKPNQNEIKGLIYLDDDMANAKRARELFARTNLVSSHFQAQVVYVGHQFEQNQSPVVDFLPFKPPTIYWRCAALDFL